MNQKSGRFQPDEFEDQYETAHNKKRADKPITPKERPRGENVVDLMDALRRSVGALRLRPRLRRSRQKAAKGGGRPKADADAYPGQKVGEGGGGEEACGQTSTEVGLASPQDGVV